MNRSMFTQKMQFGGSTESLWGSDGLLNCLMQNVDKVERREPLSRGDPHIQGKTKPHRMVSL